MKYGVIVCTKEHLHGLDFATKEVEDKRAVHNALNDVLEFGPEAWRFILVCHIEDMPALMEGFVPEEAGG